MVNALTRIGAFPSVIVVSFITDQHHHLVALYGLGVPLTTPHQADTTRILPTYSPTELRSLDNLCNAQKVHSRMLSSAHL